VVVEIKPKEVWGLTLGQGKGWQLKRPPHPPPAHRNFQKSTFGDAFWMGLLMVDSWAELKAQLMVGLMAALMVDSWAGLKAPLMVGLMAALMVGPWVD
jgi:hypothetical protein